jgi:hypothetical protein
MSIERMALAALTVFVGIVALAVVVALSSHREAAEASFLVPLEPDWGGR